MNDNSDSEDKKEQKESKTDIYSLRGEKGADVFNLTSEEIRNLQMPRQETLDSSGGGELYELNRRKEADEVRGPDLRVLFADSKFTGGEVYGLGKPNAPPPEPKEKPVEPVSADGVYGVASAGERVYASDVLHPGKQYEDPDEKYQGIAGNKDFEGEISLELLYGRRQERERTGVFSAPAEGAEEEPLPEKSELPRHPFVRGVFRPFFSPGFIVRICMMTFAALVPFYPGVYLFSRVSDELAEFEKTLPSEAAAVEALSPNVVERFLHNPRVEQFLLCLYQDRVILFFVCFVWGVFAVPYFLHVFAATAAGDDVIEDWPELSMTSGIGQFLWLLLLVFMAGVPGWLILAPFGWPELGFIVGMIFLTPIFFLSCMETDTLFTLVSSNIVQSLRLLHRAWRQFWILSVGLYIIALFLFSSILWNVAWGEVSQLNIFCTALLSSLLFSILPVIYLRYLGRLAWLIQETIVVPRREAHRRASREIPDADMDSAPPQIQPHPLAFVPQGEPAKGTGRFRLPEKD